MQLISGRAAIWTLEAWPRGHALIHCLGYRLQFKVSLEKEAWPSKRPGGRCRLDWKLLMLSALSPDEHADEAAGSSQLLQPPELWQRLQQQQPSRRHPGLLSGVYSVTRAWPWSLPTSFPRPTPPTSSAPSWRCPPEPAPAAAWELQEYQDPSSSSLDLGAGIPGRPPWDCFLPQWELHYLRFYFNYCFALLLWPP